MANADIVNTWFRERLASGAIARDTLAYNQVLGALPDLIARLNAAATSGAVQASTAVAAAPAPGEAAKAAEAPRSEVSAAPAPAPAPTPEHHAPA